MPITRLLAGTTFSPDQTREMVHAYESVLVALGLTDRADPICELVAKQIIACADGDFDRSSLHDCAVSQLTK